MLTFLNCSNEKPIKQLIINDLTLKIWYLTCGSTFLLTCLNDEPENDEDEDAEEKEVEEVVALAGLHQLKNLQDRLAQKTWNKISS